MSQPTPVAADGAVTKGEVIAALEPIVASAGGVSASAGGPSPASPSPSSPGASSTLTQLVEQIGALYKSKLSLSLRTVQLRRLMRDQFLENHVHPDEQQSADDAEVARWIASCALSQLEIEDEQRQHLQQQGEDDEELEEEGGEEGPTQEGEKADGEDTVPSSLEGKQASPLDLSVRHTPVLAANLAVNVAPVSHVASARPDSLSRQSSLLSPMPGEELSLPAAPFLATSHSPFSGSSITPPAHPPSSQISGTSPASANVVLAPPTPPSEQLRCATPIISATDSSISQLIGSGFNTSKRSSIIRSSTQGSLSNPAAGAQVVKNRPAAAIPVPSFASIHTFSLPPSGRSSPLPSPPVPATAFALVSDQPSVLRSVSHPPSPAMMDSHQGHLTISATPGISRSISDNRPRSRDSNAPSANSTPPRRHSAIYFTVTPAVTEALHKCWQWDFDLWEFISLCPDTPLTTMSCYLLERWGLFTTFNIDRATFHRFISMIEIGYLDNAYHNKNHACDVVQSIHVLLLGFVQTPSKDGSGALCASLTPLDVLAAIIAAAIHDYKHTGQTNLFHTNSVSDLAIRYNDVSVLEQMHLSEAFSLILRHKECDIFASLSRDQRREIRETIIQMVLATDMKNHITMLTDLQANIEQKKAKNVWFDVSSRADRLLLLKNCLHLSDVANSTKPTVSCVRWAEAIVSEWFAQGDLERQLGLEISPMMDRATAGSMPKSQMSWIDYVIKPLFETWEKITPLTSIPLQYLQINRSYWVAREQATQQVTPPTTGGSSASSAQDQPCHSSPSK